MPSPAPAVEAKAAEEAPAAAPAAKEAKKAPVKLTPAVPVDKSIDPNGEYIVCLEDGKKLKMLKRYLRRFSLTPEEYRARWSLPKDYPMVAPNYSTQKSKYAKAVGLGTHAREAAEA
jgi:predicted transcriptional regulator